MKVAIFGSRHQKKEQIINIFSSLQSRNIEIAIQERFYDYLSTTFDLQYNVEIIKDNNFISDLVISIGGDGTFLRTTTCIGNKDIPIFGVNTGRLGFLSDTSSKDFDQAITELVNGEYRIEERTQLELLISSPIEGESPIALNEVAILKQDTASMITVHVSVDNEFLSSYEADGLLIATPTGSTAYALSVGGPILSPTLSSLILAPVASHSLNSRPLIVDDSSELSIEVESRNEHYLISLDGRSTVLSTDVTFKIKKADYKLKIAKRESQTFYKTLRNKLMWGADPRLNNQ